MSEHTPCIHTSYLHHTLNPDTFNVRVKIANKVLSAYDYDSFAFRGMSGALLGAPLAHLFKKTMLVVRKPGVDCHTDRAVEGDFGARRYVIVDDVISSGNTVRTIIRAIKHFAPHAECVGILVWEDLCDQRDTLEECSSYLPSAGDNYDKFGVLMSKPQREYLPEWKEVVRRGASIYYQQETSMSEVLGIKTSEENKNENEVNEQVAAKASQTVLSSKEAFNTPVYGRRLQRSAKSARPKGVSGFSQREVQKR